MKSMLCKYYQPLRLEKPSNFRLACHIIACVKPVHQAGDGRPVDIQTKTRTSRSGFSLMLLQMKRKSSGDGPEAGAHQADTVEIGLFPGVFFSPLAGLVALVQQLDFLELLERFAQQALGILKLNPQFLGGAGPNFPALGFGPCISSVSGMAWVPCLRAPPGRI